MTPKNFRRGVLPRRRRFGCVPGVPAYADVMPVFNKLDWPEYMEEHIPLHDLVPPCYGWENVDGIYSQGDVGSCGSEASDQGLSMLRVASGQPWVEFNAYAQYRYVNNGRDRGSTLDDNVEHLMKHGAIPAILHPRSLGWVPPVPDEVREFGRNYRLLEAFDVESQDQCISAILSGHVVYYGSDGHAKCFIGLKNLKTGIYVNSWGSKWGNGGYGLERISNINWRYACFALRVASWYAKEVPQDLIDKYGRGA